MTCISKECSELKRRAYLGDLGRGQGFGKLTPPKAIEVLRSLTRELTSTISDGSSLRGSWTGVITISMSSSGRYMVRGREAPLSLGFRNCSSSNMHRYAGEVEVAGEVGWFEVGVRLWKGGWSPHSSGWWKWWKRSLMRTPLSHFGSYNWHPRSNLSATVTPRSPRGSGSESFVGNNSTSNADRTAIVPPRTA